MAKDPSDQTATLFGRCAACSDPVAPCSSPHETEDGGRLCCACADVLTPQTDRPLRRALAELGPGWFRHCDDEPAE